MTTTVYMIFDFSDSRLADRARITGLMQALADDGFRFLKKAIVCDDMPGERYVPSEPALLDRAWSNAVRAAPRYNGQYWMEYESVDGAALSFGFDPRRLRRLMLAVPRERMRPGQDSAHRAALAHSLRVIGATLEPAYGFGLFSYDVHDLPAIGAAPAGVWDYNWFGPALLAQYGTGMLAGLPAHASAGVGAGWLVEMSASVYADWPAAAPRYRQAAAALGLAEVFHDG
jgi:hypothetical protein